MWPNLDLGKKKVHLWKKGKEEIYIDVTHKNTHTPLIIYLSSKLRRGEATESKKKPMQKTCSLDLETATCTTYSSCSPPWGENKVKRSFTAVFSSTTDPRDRRWNGSDISAALLKGIWAGAVRKRGSGCFAFSHIVWKKCKCYLRVN